MKTLLLLLTLTLPNKTPKAREINYVVTNVKPKPSLAKNMAQMVFNVNAPDKCAKNKRQYSIDGGKFVSIFNTKGKASQLIVYGKHKLRFVAPGCDTITTDSIEFKKQTTCTITLHFTAPTRHHNEPKVVTFKPVIYLYPVVETNYVLLLNYVGELTFTYPTYTENGWNITAQPNGTLVHKNKSYNYLFWDGEMNEKDLRFDKKMGFAVHTKNLTAFFEETLTQAGLNSKEAADFITFWVPKMMEHETCYVHFLFTEQYNQIASLVVNPKPDAILRLYMVWSPIPTGTTLDLVPQEIPVFTREKNVLVEWGGSEMLEFFKAE